MFKGFTSEWGIRALAIVHYPKSIAGVKINGSMSTVLDILTSILELVEIHDKNYMMDELGTFW
jgi:hypothetical protein